MHSLKAIEEQIAKLQAQAEEIRKKNASKAIAQIRAIMTEHDLTFDDLKDALGKPDRSSPSKPNNEAAGTPQPRYRNPETGATWSGRGKPPSWIANAYRRGKAGAFLVTNQNREGTSSSEADAAAGQPSSKHTTKEVPRSQNARTLKTAQKPPQKGNSTNKATAKKPAQKTTGASQKGTTVKAAIPGAM